MQRRHGDCESVRRFYSIQYDEKDHKIFVVAMYVS